MLKSDRILFYGTQLDSLSKYVFWFKWILIFIYFFSNLLGEPSQLPVGLSEEDNALRGKVKDLQMKMEEKRMRRQARREAKAPYQCPGSRSNSTLNIPTSTTITFAPTTNTDHTSSSDTCSTDSDLSVFPPPHPACTVTDMEIGEETMTDSDGKNREIEMTAMPTSTTATTTASSATTSTNATNSGLEQESVLVWAWQTDHAQSKEQDAEKFIQIKWLKKTKTQWNLGKFVGEFAHLEAKWLDLPVERKSPFPLSAILRTKLSTACILGAGSSDCHAGRNILFISGVLLLFSERNENNIKWLVKGAYTE